MKNIKEFHFQFTSICLACYLLNESLTMYTGIKINHDSNLIFFHSDTFIIQF